MKSSFRAIRSFLGLLGAVLLATPATYGASINYGNFIGTAVTYQSVTESSPTDAVPLFGTPTLIGNTLDFNPTFTSFATGGASDQTDGQLNFRITANPGFAIPTVMFSEAGDFTLTGAGTAATLASVSATFFIDIYAVDGVTLGAPLLTTASMTFSPASGTFDRLAFPGAGATIWSGSFNFDINAALAGANIPFVNGATEISVVLDNILTTSSENGTSARISKKDFKGVGITVPVVPEPSILALTLCGAGLMFARRRSAR